LRAGPLTPHRQAQYEQTIAAVRSAASEAAFAAAWSEGRAMRPDDLIDATLAALERRPRPPSLPPGAPPASPAPDGMLSPREREVLHLVADGATNKQVATALVVTVATARYHVASLLNKLGAANRTQAVALARQRGLL
jgi:DNA-binding NarL/FixJ family response regulator